MKKGEREGGMTKMKMGTLNMTSTQGEKEDIER